MAVCGNKLEKARARRWNGPQHEAKALLKLIREGHIRSTSSCWRVRGDRKAIRARKKWTLPETGQARQMRANLSRNRKVPSSTKMKESGPRTFFPHSLPLRVALERVISPVPWADFENPSAVSLVSRTARQRSRVSHRSVSEQKRNLLPARRVPVPWSIALPAASLIEFPHPETVLFARRLSPHP